jgi:sigma-B regulation protein RsbU (phosphoserine phosphatase)
MTDVAADTPRLDVLIADDQPDVLDALRLLLHPEGIGTHAVSSPSAVLDALSRREFDLLLMDLNYARDTTSGREGLDLLSEVRALDANLPIVVMTGWGTMEIAIEALRHGVRDFVHKPWDNDRVIHTVRSLGERRRRERRAFTRQARELEDARRIQRGLLPAALPRFPGWDIAAVCDEAASVGGDTYDVIQLDAVRLAICIADVAGKGIPAALLAANLQAAVRSSVGEHPEPAQACQLINRSLCATVPDDRFVTFFLAVLDTSDGTLSYCNAGHNPPLLVGADGEATLLSGGGTVLGVSSNSWYESRRVEMAPGSVLVLYTDGITEACNADDEEFGEMRLGARVAVDRGLTAPEIRDNLLQAVRAFSDVRADDQTVLVVAARKREDVA